MRKFLFAILALFIILLLALIIIPFLVPSSVYKDAIQTRLTQEFSRDVSIEGDIKVSPFPVLKAQTGRITIANAEGFLDEYFASMNGMDARIKLRPLLSKRVEIASFTLKDPEIYLEKRKDGQTNWTFGDQPTDIPETGPFKRDGRYTDLNPSIGTFTLKNGTVSYVDAVKGHAHRLEKANMTFALPNLSQEVSIHGDAVFNGLPLDLQLSLDTPMSFLKGQKTPVSIVAKTDFGNLNAEGSFTESEDITFVLDLQSTLRDLSPLKDFLPKNLPITEIVQKAELSGEYSYDGKTMSAKGANISVSGPLIDTIYQGDAIFSGTPILTGNLDVNLPNVPALETKLGRDIDSSGLAKSLTLKADIMAKDQGFASDNISAVIKGESIDVSFSGQGAFDGTPSANGNFTANTTSIPSLIEALKIDLPQAAALGSASAQGTLSLAGKDLSLDLSEARTDGSNLTASYQGKIIKSGEALSVNGAFDSVIPSLSEFANAVNMEMPYADSIERITAKGRINGRTDNIAISDIDIQLKDGQMNGQYTGNATYNNGLILDGYLDADIPSARRLAERNGTQLPASTSAGQIYEHVALKGNVTGTPSKIKFSSAEITMDDMNGSGDFTLDMTDGKPAVIGDLNMGTIDLRPYMAAYMAQNAGQGIQPWNQTPYNFSALRTMDGTFTVKTPKVVIGNIEMGQTDVKAEVRNGVMTARLPEINLYGGLGVLTATLDASSDTPKMKMDVRLEDITSNRFLSAVSNFTKLDGKGHTLLEITAEGKTQDAIMKSLNGYGDFEVLNGAISGIDLNQFLGGIDEALTSKVLPKGLGNNYTTKFENIVGKFKISNGVVSIDSFNLSALGAAASGSGKLDIGNQALDFRLHPRLSGTSASDLAKFGIPLKFSGPWGQAKVGPDEDMLVKIGKKRLARELTNQVGGELGNVLGNVLGGGNPANDTSSSSENSTETPQETTPTNPGETVVNNLLGNVLGNNPSTNEPANDNNPIDEVVLEEPEQLQEQTDKPSEEKAEDKSVEEEIIEGALDSLFGKKKKKSND